MEINISRFKNRTQITLDIEIVTPLFSGGAEQSPELRVPAIKGMVRFWWRALYGFKYCQGNKPLENLKKREDQLFGGAASQTLKSDLIMSLEHNLKPEKMKKTDYVQVGKYNNSIIDYLAFGICTYDKNIKKNSYNKKTYLPGGNFKLNLEYSKKITHENQEYDQENEIINTFRAFFTYGGLGAKARNGFGSLRCSNLPTVEFEEDYQVDYLDYTAFTKHSRLFVGESEQHWEKALGKLGKLYREARMSLDSNKRHYLATPVGNHNDRHSKSYFLHVNKTDNGKYRPQILYLPYRYKRNENNNFNQSHFDKYKEVYEAMNKIISDKKEINTATLDSKNPFKYEIK